MHELSLFSGVGCGLLGTQALGLKTMACVENNKYKQKVLQARMNEGYLDKCPIYGDIRNIKGKDFTGRIDIISGGFPCQAFSTAARGANIKEKNLWPEMARIINSVKPGYVFAENVSNNAIETAGEYCVKMGYKVEMLSLSGKDLGADHIRRRYWLLAYANDKSELCSTINAKMAVMPKVCEGFWKTRHNESGVSNGNTNRVDRFTAIGDGQISIVAAAALFTLANYC